MTVQLIADRGLSNGSAGTFHNPFTSRPHLDPLAAREELRGAGQALR